MTDIYDRDYLYSLYEQEMRNRAKACITPEPFGSWIAENYLPELLRDAVRDEDD